MAWPDSSHLVISANLNPLTPSLPPSTHTDKVVAWEASSDFTPTEVGHVKQTAVFDT